jgi:hypothetical protein
MQNQKVYRLLSSAALAFAVVATPTIAPAQSTSQSSSSTRSATSDARTLNELTVAAQRLRDATHELVRDRASPERNQAIQKIDRTLVEVQSAILSLPTKVLLADANVTPTQEATDDLARAADRLHDAISSLNKTENSDQNQKAVSEIKEALASVQRDRTNLQAVNNVAGTSSTGGAASQAASSTHQGQLTENLPGELRQKMKDAGYKNVKIVPGSYLVSAKDKDGKDVIMSIGPTSMTVLTEGGTTSATNGQSSRQPE